MFLVWVLGLALTSRHLNVLNQCRCYIIIPPINCHPTCEDLLVTYGRWLLTRIKLQEFFCEWKTWHIYICTLLKIIFCMQFLSSDIGGSILSLKVVCIFWVSQHVKLTWRSDHVSVVAYKRLKTMKQLYNCHLKEWLQWLTRSSNYRFLTAKILAVGIGGCRWRLDCITVCDNFFSGNSLLQWSMLGREQVSFGLERELILTNSEGQVFKWNCYTVSKSKLKTMHK